MFASLLVFALDWDLTAYSSSAGLVASIYKLILL